MKIEDITNQLTELNILPNPSFAIGNDVVYLPNFDKSLTPEFIDRVYTVNEIVYCKKFENSRLRYASTWAAKEAAYKAIKQINGNLLLGWRDIDIQRKKPQGKPTINIKKLKMPLAFSLTISHDGDYVWALVICCTPHK